MNKEELQRVFVGLAIGSMDLTYNSQTGEKWQTCRHCGAIAPRTPPLSLLHLNMTEYISTLDHAYDCPLAIVQRALDQLGDA